MVAFCQEHGVPYDLCGKTVIATDAEEIPRLHALFERGTANGVEGLKLLNAEEIREYEPHAAGIAGIRVPKEGITDYSQVCVEMVKEIREWGGEIQFSSEAKRMERRDRVDDPHAKRRLRGGFPDQLRGAALRSGGPEGGQQGADEDRAVSRRILPDQAGAAIPGART